MKRWIRNDTETRTAEDADAGFEVAVVDAAEYDRLHKSHAELLVALRKITAATSRDLCLSQEAMMRRERGEYSDRIIEDMQLMACARVAIANAKAVIQ